LPQFLDGRPVTLQNMFNIFDFMNVQSIHNKAFADALPAGYLERARDLANWHEYNIFSSPSLDGIGNIAGRTILPSILDGFSRIASSTDPMKILYMATAYKPFLSLFNMTGAAQMNPQLAGVVNYAAIVSMEVRQSPSSTTPFLRFNFKNGTDDVTFKTYNILNQTGDFPMDVFVNYLQPPAISALKTWCTVCGNTKDRGCADFTMVTPQKHMPISPVGAGFLGAGLTLAVAALLLGVLFFLGALSLGRSRSKKTTKDNDSADMKA